ncbi:MAG: hypothetical protein KL839_03980 [Rhizobium sp.]|nr:hypothetical protein [Rhizobium sp.]
MADIHNPNEALAATIGRTRAKLDVFCGGKTVVFSLNPFGKSPATLVSRNKPVRRGIVELRPTAYNPDVRLFGGFAATDVLVLLTWAYKTGIVYKSEVAACHIAWKAMFGNASPIVGETHAEYISSNVIAG